MKIDEGIAIAQAQQLHRNWPTLASGNALGYAAAFLCRDTAPSAFLQSWVVALTLLAAGRVAMWHHYRHRAFDAALARRVVTSGLIGAVVSGVLWGGGLAFLLTNASALQRDLLLLTAMGLSVSAMFSYGCHFPTFLAFYIPSIVSLLPTLVFQNTPDSRWFAVGMSVFVATVAVVARNFNRMVLQSLSLRFDKLALVEQLTVQKDIAESANLSKSRFLAAASHDLAQPMNALGLYLGTLRTLALPAAAQELCANVGQCTQSIHELLASLLDVSKLDAGAVQPEPREFMIAAVLERIRIEFEPCAKAKGLDLRIAPCSAWVLGDAFLIERIVRNLVSNAVRYTERGTILLGCRRSAGRLRLAVYDTGIGIAPVDQRLIFEEFVQLGNAQRDRSQGIGLGLSIVERLARLQGLALTLKSAPGRGSVFMVDLPLTDAAVHAQALAAPAPVAHEALDFAGRQVVVVDDEPLIQHATRGLLEAWGCSVVTAASGQEALAQLSGSLRPPDLLLCDYRLGGGMNGLQGVQALREEFNHDVAAIIVTGDTAVRHLRELEASGLHVLHKPLAAHTLRQAMLRAIQPACASAPVNTASRMARAPSADSTGLNAQPTASS